MMLEALLFKALLFILAFLVLISILIVIHELGHYTIARLCGVKVLRFSLGFGKVIWSRRVGRDQTEWTLSVLPLGGYVKMLDERETEEPIPAGELPRAFNRQPVGKRTAIVAAGPLANFLLAILIYAFVFWQGEETLLPILGAPQPDTPAAAAGIRNGERVTRVGEVTVATWEDFHWQVMENASGADHVRLELADDAHGTRRTLDLAVDRLDREGWKQDPFTLLGLRPYRSLFPAVVGKLQPEMPAAAAGIAPDDVVTAVAGRPVAYIYQVQDAVLATPEGASLQLTLRRGATMLEFTLTPQGVWENGVKRMRVGLQWAEPSKAALEAMPELWTTVRYGLLESSVRAVRQIRDTSVFSLRMFGKMLTGQVSLKNLSGPVAIAEYAGKSARMGLAPYLKFMALVSVSLGILNLLPIPVLDGGHLLYYALEIIKGSAPSERFMVWGQNVGIAFLVTLMAFALFNDLSRLLAPFFSG
ncbi:MAG: RIP metalloprotease RseP [Zoogloeaceae bacterium]|jgi:regulator of sigma E protease|nr:RIP metalloprotease RseP [Zoogloeaceae bacterium]